MLELWHGENKLDFDEMVMSGVHSTSRMSWICIVLGHRNSNLRVDMSLYTDTLF